MEGATSLERLRLLNRKIRDGQASEAETEEYLDGLYRRDGITADMYASYLRGERREDILWGAIIIGDIILAGEYLKTLLRCARQQPTARRTPRAPLP